MNRLARKLWISILIVMICIICAFLWLTSGRSIRVTSAMVQQLIDQAVKVVKQKEGNVA